MSDIQATLRLRREPVEAARSAKAGRVRRALQGRSPIAALGEAEQDAVFDGMLDAYADPPAGVRDRLAGVAERTREVLGREHAERQDAAA